MPMSERTPARPAPIAELAPESAALGVTLSDAAITRFQNYIDTLMLWRTRLALTTAATPQQVVRDHILDSLVLCRFIQPGMRVADLGSGAGFPGVPLAIACDGARFSLVESRRKKANFLREVVRSAMLANVEVIEERAERLADGVTKPWDLVVSRAVWALADFLAVSERLLVRDGLAIAMKGPKASGETLADRRSFVPTDIVEYKLTTGARHRLLVYRRV
jgi:16S rRNA (guanine527-N7)-methyltransferase